MLKALYYAHFALWRACRASRDVSFGTFRVQALLLMIEVNFFGGILLLILGEQIESFSLPVLVMGIVIPLVGLNFYLFEDAKKREKYERQFASYPPNRRYKLDALTFVVSIGAGSLPVIAYLSK